MASELYRIAEYSPPTKHVEAAGETAMGRGFNSRRLHHAINGLLENLALWQAPPVRPSGRVSPSPNEQDHHQALPAALGVPEDPTQPPAHMLLRGPNAEVLVHPR